MAFISGLTGAAPQCFLLWCGTAEIRAAAMNDPTCWEQLFDTVSENFLTTCKFKGR